MATPTYKGQGQPPAAAGWFGSLFGVQPPQYSSGPTTTQAGSASSMPRIVTTSPPVYQTASALDPTSGDDDDLPARIAIVIPRGTSCP